MTLSTNFYRLLLTAFICISLNNTALFGQFSGDCMSFNGANDFVTVSTDPVDQIDSSDFTFEAWIRGDDALQNPHPTIFSNRATTAYGDGIIFGFHGLWGGSPNRMLFIQLGCGNHFLLNNGGYGNILDNDCHHVAITRADSLLSYYVDGNLIGTRLLTCPIASTISAADLLIGKDGPTSNDFNGTISEVMIWKTARTATEIQSDMQANTNPTNPDLLAYYELNTGSGQLAADNSSYGHDGGLGATSFVDASDPSWGADCCLPSVDSSCLFFDGADDFVTVASDPVDYIDTSNFTFEAWVRGDDVVQNTHPTIFSNRATTAYGDGIIFGFHGLWGGSPNRMLFVQLGCGNHFLLNNGGYGNILDNNCHHVAITRAGSLLSYYVDGNLIGTRSLTCPIASTISAADLLIGKDGPTSNDFNGTISDVMIWKTARTATEIQSDMQGSTNPSDPNLLAFYELSEGNGQLVTDQSTYGHDGELGTTGIQDAEDPNWGADCCETNMCVASVAPQNFAATVIGSTVKFSWDAVPASVGCQIKVGPYSGGFTERFNVIGDEVDEYILPASAIGAMEYKAKVRCACSLSPIVATPFSAIDVFGIGLKLGMEGASEVKLYPNPAVDIFNLSFKTLETGTIELTDLFGKSLKVQDLASDLATIDISSLQNGIYLVTVRTKHGTVVQKFEVLH